MLGNVLSTRSVRTPGANGVYRLGSNVSVCAMPPAIQRTITASAAAFEAGRGVSAGSCPQRADKVAAAVAPTNPLRLSCR